MKIEDHKFILLLLIPSILLFAFSPAAYALDWDRTEIEQHAGIGEALLPYVFTCTNTSTAVVTIAKIRSSCGCLTSALDNKKLAPGESAHLTVNFDRTGYTGDTTRSITIVTDEPNHNTYQLVLRANLPGALTLLSRFVRWERGERVKAKSIDIKINLSHPTEITRATSNHDNVIVKLVTLEAGRHYRLDIMPRDTTTPCFATITLHPDEPLPTGTPLTVFAQVR
jgi:hypothetical protein